MHALLKASQRNANYSVITVVAGLDPAAGGPSYTVPALASAVARQGVPVQLITTASGPGIVPPLLEESKASLRVVTAAWGSGLRVPGGVSDALRATETALVHVHGLWMPACFLTGMLARRRQVPLVISPRGMLEPWAWQHRAWKKRPVWWLCERRNVQYAAVLHATSQDEADNLRRLGLYNPIAVIPNGVEMPAHAARTGPSHTVDGCRTILFLSRIHPKKGLFNLVAAWQLVRQPGWQVVVAGPDMAGHLDAVRAAAQRAGVASDFRFPGAVYGEEKWRMYQQADLFVLPTFSENFGVSIAEALAMRLPVIATKGAPWKSLEERHCGWWVDVGVPPLADALRAAMSLTDEQRHEMGCRGADLVRDRFSWDRLGSEMARVYDWVMGRGDRPGCVQM